MATLSFKALAPAAQRAGERASWHTDQMRTDWGVPLLPLSNMTNRETLGGGRVSYVIERRSEVDEWVMWAPGPTRETGHSGKLPLVNYRTALGQLRALNMGGFMGRGIYAGIPAHTALWGEGSLQGYQHTQRVWLRFQRWLSRIWSAVSQYLSFTPVVMPYAIQPTQGEFSLAFFLHNKLGHAILWEVNYLTSWRCLMTVPLGTPVRVSCTPSMVTNEKKNPSCVRGWFTLSSSCCYGRGLLRGQQVHLLNTVMNTLLIYIWLTLEPPDILSVCQVSLWECEHTMCFTHQQLQCKKIINKVLGKYYKWSYVKDDDICLVHHVVPHFIFPSGFCRMGLIKPECISWKQI